MSRRPCSIHGNGLSRAVSGLPWIKRTLSNTWLFPRYLASVYLRPAMSQAAQRSSGKLLDIGCGRRQYEPLFAGRVSCYIGMDWPVIAGRARPDVIGDALHIPFASESIDIVVATELMEHLPAPGQFLQEVARVLRIGGSVILSTPFMEALHEEPRDYYRFTPHGLRTLLEEHGFAVEEIVARGGWWAVLGSFVSQALYELANPEDVHGNRPNGVLAMLAAPFCALVQLSAYIADRIVKSRRYTLGYLAVATRIVPPRG